MVFSVHFLAKNSNRYGNLPYFTVICLTNKTRRGRDHQEDAAVAAAIAAVAAASKANTKANARANARAIDGSGAAVAGAVSLADANAKAVDAVIFDFAASIDIDDDGVAMAVDEAEDIIAARGDDAVGDGNVGVGNVGGGGGGGRGVP